MVVDPCFGEIDKLTLRFPPISEIFQRTFYRMYFSPSIGCAADLGDRYPAFTNFVDLSRDNDQMIFVG